MVICCQVPASSSRAVQSAQRWTGTADRHAELSPFAGQGDTMPGLAHDSGSPGGRSLRPTSGATVVHLRRIPPEGASAPASSVRAFGNSDAAAFWERIFQGQGRSLADPDTAQVHQITAATIGLLIDGAHADGRLDHETAVYLTGLVGDAVRAPQNL
jgi:hypothetical protein